MAVKKTATKTAASKTVKKAVKKVESSTRAIVVITAGENHVALRKTKVGNADPTFNALTVVGEDVQKSIVKERHKLYNSWFDGDPAKHIADYTPKKGATTHLYWTQIPYVTALKEGSDIQWYNVNSLPYGTTEETKLLVTVALLSGPIGTLTGAV